MKAYFKLQYTLTNRKLSDIGLIRKLREMGKTVIISSHVFSTLSDTCDEIHLLSKGEIIQKVSRENFDVLEAEMKEFTIGDKIEKLELK